MSWNSNLYCYSREQGGTYFGSTRDGGWESLFTLSGWDASLLLEHRGEPLLVTCGMLASGRGGTSYEARALLRCTLQRDYRLKISARSAARQGMNAVLNQLDRGAEKLGMDLGKEEPFQELKGRGVKSSDPGFTRLVLGNLELRNALMASPKYGVAVAPCRPSVLPGGDLTHLIEARAPVGDDWGADDPNALLDGKPEEARPEDRSFFRRLDALIDLAKLVRAAVTMWPMPEQAGNGRS